MRFIKLILQFSFISGLCFFLFQCTTAATGTVTEPTNDLQNTSSMDLFIDTLRLEQDVNSGDFENDDDTANLEIHILDGSGTTLLACVGADQDQNLSRIAYDILYAQVGAQFQTSGDVTFNDDTAITLKLVNKLGDYQACPAGYNSVPVSANDQDPIEDLIVAEETTTYGALFNGDVTIDEDITLTFRMSSQSAQTVTAESNLSGGSLAVNQIYIADEEFNDDELTNPEIGLFLAPFGSFSMTACLEIDVLELGSVLYAELDDEFQDAGNDPIALDDLDSGETYWLILAELDGDRCPEPTALTGGQYDLLATTEELNVDDLTGSQVDFSNGFGYLNLYLR